MKNSFANQRTSTFRPPWQFLVFWFVGGIGMLLFGIAVVNPVLNAPAWVRWFFIGLPSLALMVGVVLLFASVRVDGSGIASRHFARWSVRWSEIEAWGRLRPRGSLYVRTRDGRIRSFSSWCVYGGRCDRLALLLEQKLGPERGGKVAR